MQKPTLVFLCMQGDATKVRARLLETKCNVNRSQTMDPFGDGPLTIFLPLEAAAEMGHLKVCKVLVDEGGADVDGMFNPGKISCVPLISATVGGHADVVRFLLSRGADVDRDGGERTTAQERNHYFHW